MAHSGYCGNLESKDFAEGCHRVAQALRPAYKCCCALGFDPGYLSGRRRPEQRP